VGVGVTLGRVVNGRREVYVTQLFAANAAQGPDVANPDPPARRR
jgi:hypothetical protein